MLPLANENTAEITTLSVEIKGIPLHFRLAQAIAKQLAATCVHEPMLIAWYDGINHEEHPHVPECQHKPGWIAYAEGHGGCIRVNVNGSDFNFIYAESSMDIHSRV